MNPTTQERIRSRAHRPPDRLPPLTIGEALARRWMLIALTTILAAAAGVAVGLRRAPVYTSESELNAGSLDAQAQAIPGYAQAAQTLAEAYARVVGTPKIQVPVARHTHSSIDYVAAHLTAANIPSNPVFRIDGSGATAAAAQRLTAAATREIVKYARVQTTPPNATKALNTYKTEAVLAGQLDSKVANLKLKYAPTPTPGQKAKIADVQQQAAAAQLQADASQQVYIAAITNATDAGTVIVLSRPGPATSNRKQTAEIAGFGGAVVGCLIGCGIAVRLAARRRRQVIQSMLTVT
jgi:hypothetical protein